MSTKEEAKKVYPSIKNSRSLRITPKLLEYIDKKNKKGESYAQTLERLLGLTKQ